jgi:hypothetical protein
MQDYFNFVNQLAEKKEDKLFFNSGPIHASFVMSRIFQHAEKEIKIYSGGFSGVISNDPLYLQTLRNFLDKKDTTLKILINDYENNKEAQIYKLLKKYSHKVTIRQTEKKVTDTDTDQPIHFTIGDEKMLRIETNTKDFTAQVNFNTNTEYVNGIFEKIYENKDNKNITIP